MTFVLFYRNSMVNLETFGSNRIMKQFISINVLLFPLVHNINTLETYKIV